jgi:hypothetical protein
MSGKKGEQSVRQRPAAVPSYSYAQVEAALGKVYDAEDETDQRTTFRARLKHLRKNRIPHRKPGKGGHIRYTAGDIFQLLIACEFSEFGIDPKLIAEIIRLDWRQRGHLFQAIDITQRFPEMDWYVAIEPRIMSWAWTRKKIKITETEISISSTARPVAVHTFKASDATAWFDELQKGRRLSIFNLSARVRAIEKALASGQDQ